MTLNNRLQRVVELQPDKTAIQSEAGQLRYDQLQVLIDQCAEYFLAQGLSQGDRVAILSLNHPDWFVALFAAARCGIILVPLNWRLSVSELSFVLDDSAPAVLLHDSGFRDVAGQLHALHPGIQRQPFANNEFPVMPAKPASIPLDPPVDTPLLIVYTSGTTGRPKGAVLDQKALMCSADMSHHMYDMTDADNVLNVLPLFHVGGLNIQPLPALLCGATLYLQERFIPENAVRALSDCQITLINTVPTLLQAMLDDPAWNKDNLSCLRAISIGSTDVPVPLIQQVHNNGIPLIQVYGATETAPVAIYQRIEDAHVVGSIGRTGSLCQIRLTDQEGRVVATGDSGEIEVKGDNILQGYWNNDEATQASVTDGWFKTGDVAHQDSDGFYWFDDRLKHVVISGGENIYPAELERVIREIPEVQEVAVVGRADDRWGEVPVAVVVGNVGKQAVLQACATLARFKQPGEVYQVDALPRNALGKVQVQQLKDQLRRGRP